MGISTIPSYCGAQIFEAVGLSRRARRPSLHRHRLAHRRHRASRRSRSDTLAPARARLPGHAGRLLPVIGLYAWRRDGEHHQWNPETIALAPARGARTAAARRTRSTRSSSTTTRRAARRSAGCCASARRRTAAIPLEEVEPAKRDRQALRDRRDVARLALARGARDARDRDEPDRRHARTPARAARIRCASRRDPNGDSRRSAIKQVASGPLRRQRSTTSRTPTSCRSRWRRARSPARAASCRATRSTATSRACALTTPGVGLISPPPHHDIYSIEDLEAADLRPALREPGGARLGEARRRGRRRHGRRRRREGERRPRADLRPRRRHRRLAAVVDPVRRRPVGDRARRDAADARARTTCARGSGCRRTAS